MAAMSKTFIVDEVHDLQAFLKDKHPQNRLKDTSWIKTFNCSAIYEEAFMNDPDMAADLLSIVADKCTELQVLEIYENVFEDEEDVKTSASAIKEIADRVLGHHPNLTRLVQEGGMTILNGVYGPSWALLSKRESEPETSKWMVGLETLSLHLEQRRPMMHANCPYRKSSLNTRICPREVPGPQ
jgi:hypothetical protein